jgi:hypothetical protein
MGDGILSSINLLTILTLINRFGRELTSATLELQIFIVPETFWSPISTKRISQECLGTMSVSKYRVGVSMILQGTSFSIGIL